MTLCECTEDVLEGFRQDMDRLQVFLELERNEGHDLELLLKSSDASVTMELHTRRFLTGVT